MTQKLLRVTARSFVAGAVFERDGDEWKVKDAAPILRWLWRVKTADMAAELRGRGCSWEWLWSEG